MNLFTINANWFWHSTLTTVTPTPTPPTLASFSPQLWDAYCNFAGHLIRYLVHHKSIVISKKGGWLCRGMGGGAELHSQAEAPDDVIASASTPIPPEGFILNENMSCCNLSQMGGFCLCVCVCYCCNSAFEVCVFEWFSCYFSIWLHISDVWPASGCSTVCEGESRDSARWCVSCHHTPFCLHVDLLDLQLTNLSVGLIFLPKGST